MPSWLYYLLLASVFVSLIIGAIATVWMVRKRKRLKQTLLTDQTPSELASHMKAFNAPTFGQLDLALKASSKTPLDDELMVFAINTVTRNAYQTVTVFNSASNYESASLVKFTTASLNDDEYDFALVLADGKIYEQLKSIYAHLKPGGMMHIVNLRPRSSELRTLVYDLKVLSYRFERLKIASGVIVVAK